MGNQILGKRSRNYYRGLNQRQINYIKEKFSTISKNNVLDRELFRNQYKLTKNLDEKFYQFVDFDQEGGISEYEFICAVHTFCNMTVSELGAQFFSMLTTNESLKQKQMKDFTEVCLKYNYSLENKPIDDKEITKINKQKFLKYDYDKNKSISKEQFIALCTKDQDFKKWFFNMGFITKNQLQFHDQVYDLVDSDIDEQIQRHLKKSDPKVDKVKRGIEHKIPSNDEFEELEDEGDQSVPNRNVSDKQRQEKVTVKEPWQKFLEGEECKINKNMKQNPNSPSQSLTIEHIFGYRSHDCRNNIKFDSNGNIVYHQGSVGIVMNNQQKQVYMNEHKDDIVCLDVNDNLVVTGEMGSTPSVILWQTNSQNSIKSDLIITEELQQSVGNVALSKTSKFLAVNCNDSDHKLVVYDISCLNKIKEKSKQASPQIQVIIKSKGHLTKNAILDLKFTPDQTYVVAASLKQILFVRFQTATLNSDRGQFGEFSNSSALCLLPLKAQYKNQRRNWMLSGMANGSVYFWEQKKCVKAVSGHTGSVSALSLIKNKDYESFVSGDKTGKIIVWGQKFEIVNRCSIVKSDVYSNMIVSISIKDKEILVGTKSSTIYKDTLKKDLVFNEKNAVIYGHNEGNLWGLAVDQSPGQRVFYTAGEDQRLIKWQYGSQNKPIQQIKWKFKIRTIAHSHKQKVLAVGYMNGIIEIFDENLKTTKIKYEAIKNADKQILNLLRFSQDGQYLLACYTFIKPDESKKENKNSWRYGIIMFTFNRKELIKQRQIDEKSKILAVDFSRDNKYLRLNTESNEYKVYEIYNNEKKGHLQVDKRSYNKVVPDLQWSTHTVFMSPETQKFKTQGVKQSDIICCQRSSKRRNVFLIGDKYSKIKLFNYPCIRYPIFNKYEGHSNAVTAIQFDSQEKYVVSIGAEEKSIILWKYDPDQINNQQFFNELKQSVQIQSDLVKQKGEQVNANPQYKGQIIQPSNYKDIYNPKRDNKLPKQDFSIQHVFGIRNQYLKDQVRNQCRFSKNFDSFLFPTACLGVKMDLKTKKQNYFHEHKQDIVSFAVDKSRTFMATGQMAQKNTNDPRKKIVSICVWDIEKNKLLKTLNGFHTIAVVLLEFSPSGKLLFSVGNDTKNTYAVYDWKAGSILYSGPISGAKVNAIAWKNETQFMTIGNDHVKLWQNGKGRQGKFSKGKLDSMFSCAYLKDDMYATGSGSGKVFIWKGNMTLSVNDCGNGKIQTLIFNNDILYTGGADGCIKTWKVKSNGDLIKQKKEFDTRSLPQFSQITNIKDIQDEQNGILSIDFNENNDALIVTKGASVIIFNFNSLSYKNARIVHQGHYKEELWGLATYQDENYSRYLITGGDDKTVRLWDIQKKEELRRIYLQSKCRAVDCQQSAGFKIIAADQTATLHLMDKQLRSIKQSYSGKPNQRYQFDRKKDSKANKPWIEEVKISPDGTTLCYGTHGKSETLQIVEILGDKLKKKIELEGGTSAVNHIDWSRNGDKLAINTQAFQLLFYSTQNTKNISASSLKDEQWSTYTRKYGFQSQGIFQDADHSNINTICRDPTKTLLAVGYDDQTIKVFKYPCYIPKQVFKTLYGHSSHVTKIKFTNQKMVSVGGLDRTVIVWNILGRENTQVSYNEEEIDYLDEIDEDIDLPDKLFKKKPKPVPVEDFTQVVDEGDEFMAIKPWVGAIKQPTYKYPISNGKQPNATIDLQYVFGYRSKDCRQNLFYKNQQTIIYHAAAVLIQHDIKNNKQKLFNQHNDDILSIDYHQKEDMILTGQIGPKPLVCLYKGGEFIKSLKAPVTKGVIAISISPNGQLGVCVGMDADHQIAVIDISSMTLLRKQKGDKKVITKVKWISDSEFVTVGINFYAQWLFKDNKIKNIIKKSPRSNNVSIDVHQGLILVGANGTSLVNYSSGKESGSLIPQIYSKKQPTVVQAVKITEKYIFCGLKSGKVIVLRNDTGHQQIEQASFDLKTELDKVKDQTFHLSQNPSIRSIDFHNYRLLIGTLGSEIYEVQYDKNMKLKTQTWKNYMKGHYSPNPSWLNEVWGLTVYSDQNKQYIFTCSDDSTIRIWTIDQDFRLLYCHNLYENKANSQEKNKKYPDDLRLRSIAVSPNGKYIAVGAFDGTLRIFKFCPDQPFMISELLKKVKHAKQWISDIKFGFQTLIVGSHDNGIYVYNFEKGNDIEGQQDDNQDDSDSFKLKIRHKPMKKHSSYITHLDVSKDSCYLQSTCGAYEILFWDLNACKHIPGGASVLKDEIWQSWTCNIGWPVQGIYPKEQDGTFINAVDRSHTTINQNLKYDQEHNADYFLLASGNDHGKVGIYSYPSLVKNSKYIEGKGHSSHVTTVRWSKDDSRLLSVGGQDQCLMVWKVQKGGSQKINTKTATKSARKK